MGSRDRRTTYRALIAAAVIGAAAASAFLWRSCGDKPASTTLAAGASGSSGSSSSSRGRRDRPPLQKPPAGGLRLEGQVIDETDQPVAGATVRFYNFDQQTLTAEDGSFVFEHLGANDFEVIAEKGEDTWCDMIRVTLSETTEPVILRVHPAAIATVHVIDASTRKPIAGAHLGDRVTDENGDVKVHGLRPGGSSILIIGVEAVGYERSRAKISNADLANPAENVVTVEMRRGVVISGVVVGPNGRPVADASVHAQGAASSDADADGAGAFSITLAPGPRELRASANDFVDSVPIALEIAEPRAGIVLRLQAPPPEARPTLTGIVVDSAGKPVAAAEVWIDSNSAVWSEQTDAGGRFTAKLFAGATSATVSASKDQRASPDTEVLVKGDHAEVRLVIAPSSIAGVVVNPRGRPAPGVRVFLRYHDRSTMSDAKGRFDLDGLPPGDYVLFAAHTDEQFAPITQGTEAHTGSRDVKLVVTDVGNLTGRVILDGRPVTYFGAYLYEADQIYDNPVISQSPDGRFAIKGIVGGSWTLVLAGPSFGRKTIQNVRVPEDDDVDLGDIAVDRGRTVHGHVTDASGAAVAGAEVVIHERDRPGDPLSRAVQGTGIATTDAAGAFRIIGLAPSLYTTTRRIAAAHPTRGVSVERALADDASEVNLVVLKPGGIDGRLEGVETGVFASRVDDPSFTYAESPDGTGRFRFDNLPPGVYRLRPNTTTSAMALVTVVGGQRAKAQLVVSAERVEVSVAAGACKLVTLFTEDGVDEITDQYCGSAFTGVAPGTYRACADGDKRCATIKVLATPVKQSFTIR